MLTRVTLLRHGEVHNPAALFYGRLPRFGLSARGQEQARAAAAAVGAGEPAALFCSPLLRARQTAAIFHQAHPACPPRRTRRLIEVHSPFDGRPNRELADRGWDLYSGVEPPFEQPADVLARAQGFLAWARRRFPGRHVFGVTHGDVVAFTILWAAGRPVSAAGRRQLPECGVGDGYPAPASLTTFTFHTAAADEIPSFIYRRPY